MQRAGSSRSWSVLGAGLVILVGVAAAGRWLSRTSLSNAAVASGTGRAVTDGVRLVFVALFLFGAACLVMSLISGSLLGPDRTDGWRRRLGLRFTLSVLVVLAVVLLVIWFVSYRTHPPAVRPLAPHPPVPGSTEAPRSLLARYGGDWPVIAMALLVAAVVAGVWTNARRLEARSRAGGRVAPTMGPAAADETDEIDEIDQMEIPDRDLDPETEPDPRRAVVIAYHRLLVLLARRGWARRRSEAPLEHLDRIRVGHPGGMGPARSLVSAFERAEYSEHPVTIEERDQALAWLRAVVSDLDAVATTSW